MIKVRWLGNILVLSAAVVFAGCDPKETAVKVDLNNKEEIKIPDQEDIRIKIGLIPEQDIRKMAERYEPLAKYLSRKLDLKVVIVYLDSYGEVCDKFIYNQLDAAFFGSFSYALTHAKTGIEPIARPDYQGTSVYRGIILVREDGNIKDIRDMKGKRLALVHQATYAGYLYPLYYFQEHGAGKLEQYFSKIMFAGSHDKAIFALLRNEVDVAVPKDLVYQRVIKENTDLEKELVILSVSAPVPSNALCVRKDLDPALKNALKNTLLNLSSDPDARTILEALGGATSFVETRDEDYRYLYQIINALGIDLNSYPYYNRPDMGFDKW